MGELNDDNLQQITRKLFPRKEQDTPAPTQTGRPATTNSNQNQASGKNVAPIIHSQDKSPNWQLNRRQQIALTHYNSTSAEAQIAVQLFQQELLNANNF